MSFDAEELMNMLASKAKDPDIGIDSEEFTKHRLSSTDGFLLTKYKVSEDVPDEEFTEEFAQGQIKALNFINSAHRRRVEDAVSSVSDDGMTGMLSKVKVPIICLAIEAQINVMREIHDRAKEKGYNLAIFARFTNEELDDLEEERIHKLHGWTEDNDE